MGAQSHKVAESVLDVVCMLGGASERAMRTRSEATERHYTT